MSTGGNKKTTKNTPNKKFQRTLKCNHHGQNWKNAGEKFKSYEENIRRYLPSNNELLSKRINELNDKLIDLQASIRPVTRKNLKR